MQLDNKMTKVYIAGPLFNQHERARLNDIAEVLESDGYDCFLPHRDQTGLDPEERGKPHANLKQKTKDILFQDDISALEPADIVVAIITGQDIDSGTAAEIGYAYALKKPIIAIDANESRFRNLFVKSMISRTINGASELLDTIKDEGL